MRIGKLYTSLFTALKTAKSAAFVRTVLLAGVLLCGVRASAQTTTSFPYSGSIQSYTVPAGVISLQITANGAQGGSVSGGGTGGQGAILVGTVNVVPGHVLNILVGGQGGANTTFAAGGGGGSFVWDVTAGNTLLMAAGAGGGGAGGPWGNGSNASATTTPTAGGGGGSGAGGSGGNGGAGGSYEGNGFGTGGGGCGWSSNGGNGAFAPLGGGGSDPLTGGAGGTAGSNGTNGGFGGGGGSAGNYGAGGGGGGYNGGGGANDWSGSIWGIAGGGGSFNGGTTQSNSVGNTGNGVVVITTLVNPVSYNNGSSQTLTQCENLGATSINSKLTASGGTGNYTWTVVTAPSHGSLGGFPAGPTASGTSVSPTGTTYTSNSNYVGTDAFVIQVQESGGSTTALTTVNVTTTGPNLSSLSTSGPAYFCNGSGAPITVTSASLAAGTYTIGYTLSGANTGTGTVTVNVTSSATTFTTTPLTFNGSTTVTINTITDGGGCVANLSSFNTVTSTVTTPPSAYGVTIANSGHYCSGGTGVAIGMAFSDIGVNYQLFNSGTPESSPVSGTATSFSFGTYTPTGVYNVIGTNATTGCTTAMSNTVTVTTDPLPAQEPLLVSNSGHYCSGGAGVTVSVNPTVSGATYQLFRGATPVGSSVSGTGAGVVLGTGITPVGVYSVVATTTATGCTNSGANTITVTTDPLPTAQTLTSSGSDGSGAGHYCSGGTGIVISVTTTQTGMNYQLVLSGTGNIGSPIAGTGSGISFPAQTTGGTYSVVATNTTTTCTSNMSNTITVVVDPLPAPITGTPVVCAGLSTTLGDVTAGGIWSSSNTALATVGSGTGVLTGVSAGNPTITFTIVASGCYVTDASTVNALPSAITGPTSVCVGLTTATALGSTPSGGAWSSSNTAIGTINSSTGFAYGVSAGMVTITYTNTTTGCLITGPLTVNPTPAAITGTPIVCVGSSTSLNDGTAGGSWSSGNTSQATAVGSGASGLVTGVSGPSTPVISYTLPTGCYAVTPVTVNSVPPAMTSSTGFLYTCNGTGITLSDGSGPGTWTSGNTSVANIGSSSGVVTTVAPGTSTITYAVTATGCSTSSIVTVNAVPGAISGTAAVCMGQTTTLSDLGGGTWSSTNTSFATVGLTTGIVTGVSPGTVSIVYTLPSGCSTNVIVTVNSLPAIPGGATNVCVGSTATVTDATGGGTWTSSNPALGSVAPGTGVVTGIAQGFPNMIYTLTATGCFSSAVFTVNPLPSAFTGSGAVCVGSTTTLASTPLGGVWTSNNTALATVGSATGVVTGVANGNPAISYTLPTGCVTSLVITVNPLPSAITGINAVCTGSTTTLSDPSPSGTWSSSNPALGTVGATTGVVAGIAIGVPYISYTLSATGCYVAVPVTVNQTPMAITGTTNTCIGSSTTLADATAGGTWSSSNTALGTVSTSGVVSGLSSGGLNISYTIVPTGCFAITSYSVNPLPAAITGTMNVCVGSSTLLNDGTSGGSWTSSNTSEATITSGGVVTGLTAGLPVMTYTLPSGCIATTGITVNALPSAITGVFVLCTGVSSTLSSSPTTGTWTSGTPAQATVGSVSGVVTGVLAGNPVITYTLPTGCITTQTITVNTTPVAIAGTNAVCIGLNTTLTDATTGGTWSSSNTAEGTVVSGSGVVTGITSGIPIISYVITGTGCYATTPVTVNPNPAAITGATALCTATTVGLADATTGGVWTSSDATKASVGSVSGVVTGVAAGTPDITYTLPTGCIATQIETVSTTPVAITGPTSVCTGSNITLADGTSGGTWTSSNSGEATISSGGVVNGVTAGTPTMTYTVSTGGCFVTYAVSVNPTPAPTTGTPSVCVGLTTTLGESLSGGIWSSTSPASATVGSLTGIVTGVAAGTPGISYVMPTGCFVITPITVNPTPAAITGVTVVCAGSSNILNDVTSGGVWSSGNTLVATVVGTTGSVTGVSAGVAGITYTLGAGCYASTFMTVNAVPNISSFSSPTATAPCLGGSSVVTVNSTSLGTGTYTVSYTLSGVNSGSSTATLTMGTSTGTFTIPSSMLTATGSTTVTINQIMNTFGCSSFPSSSNAATFPVNTLPTVYNVLGGGGYCSGGTGVHIYLSNSVGGVNYQLYFGSTATGSAVAGTFAGLDFGLYTAVGTYTVNAVNATTGCTSNMNGVATVSVNPLPTQFTMTGGGAYCSGGTGVLVGLGGSQSGKTYQLYNGATLVGTPVSGTGSAISFGLQTTAGVYTAVATDATTFCTNNMIGSSSVTVNPIPSAISGTMLVCVGSTVTLTDIGGGTWVSNNPSLATIGSTTGVVTGVGAGTPTITYSLPTTCSITAVITVNPLPSAIAGPTNVCATAAINLTDPTGSGNWTSSNTSIATVGVTSGIVTGVATGVPVISYTLGTGCFVTYPVTVNPMPSAITGTFNVCNGFSTLLSDAVSGGTWTSSATSVATIGSTTGLVSGASAGTTTITYAILPGGCNVTAPFTVNPMPSAIAGVTNVCVGSGGVLTDVTTGGGWSSSNSSLATIISTTGVVSGIAAGTLTMTYTLPAGCSVTTPYTVNPTPSAITGLNNVCQGLTTTLTDLSTGGSWFSSNPSFASIGSATGIVTGVAAGSATITYTLPAGSCSTTFGFVVNPLPAAIAGVTNTCIGLSSTLTDATTGGTWTSSNTTLATVGGTTGIVTGLAAGTPNITYTIGATGCIASTPFTVNPLPSAITGITTVCAGSSVTVADASAGGTWVSNNTAIATIGSTTGVVTGVTNGVTTITYTLPTGCTITTNITVNPAPAAITGPSFVCTGSTITLADAVTGGTWTSSNPAEGSISSGGVVAGLTVGTPTITYTLPLGCSTTTQITVNPTPAAITGTLFVCAGLNTTLSDASAGGVWTSGTTANATIGSTTGVVTGVAAGNSVITYTLPAGCTATAIATVNATPVPITGINNVCVASSITLTDLTTGGVWTSGTTSQATIGGTTSTTATINGISAGTPIITYTLLPSGCNTTYTITVNPLPASITGTPTVCAGSTTTLFDASAGGSWTSSNTAVALISSTGIISGIAPGTVTYTYTLPTGCITTISGTVNALPTAFSVLGGGSYCSGSTGIDVSLSGSQSGVNYQLKNGSTVVATVLGSGSAIDYGFQTSAGTYTVLATNTLTACSATMSSSALVVINSLPTAFNMTGGGAYCAGGTGVPVGLNNATTGVNYQLYRNGVATGSLFAGTTGIAIPFGTMTSAGTYTAIALNALTGCTVNMLGTAVVTVNPLPSLFTVTGGGSYCLGTSGVHIGLTGSQTGVTYTVTGGSTASAIGTGSALDFGLFTAVGNYTVSAVSTTTSCSSVMVGAANVTVNPLPTVATLSASATAYCIGGAGVTLNLSASQSTASYQLYLTTPAGTTAVGLPVPGSSTGAAITFGVETGIGTYTAIAMNTTTACTVNMTGSPAVTVNPLPVAYTVTGGGTYCTGGTGVNIGLSSSDAGISYRLVRLVGIISTTVSTTSGVAGTPLNFGLQTTAGTYTVVAFATSGLACPITMLGSAIVNIAPLPNPYSLTGGGAYCAGGSGVPVGVFSSDAGVRYQLFNGTAPMGSPVAGTSAAISFGTETIPGTYTVIATNTSTLCSVNMLSSVLVTVNPLPNIYTVTGGGSYCAGGAGVHVYLSGSQSGISYQLYNGSATAGAALTGSGSALDFGLHTSSGSRTAIATNPLTTCSVNMLGSSVVVINPVPASFTVGGGGSYCSGSVTGVPHITLGGSVSGISYQLYNGATPVGAAVAGLGGTIDFGPYTAVGTYSVNAINATTGCTAAMTGTATITVNPLPNLYTVTGGGSYCTGGTGVAVGLSSSDTGVTYQLYNTGTAVGTAVAGTGAAISFGLHSSIGVRTAVATNNITGCTNTMTGSVTVSINPLPATFPISGGGGYCPGGSGVVVGLTGSASGVNYQLYNGSSPVGAAVAGSGIAITFGAQTGTGTYSVIATNAATTCTATMTGTTVVSLNPLPAAFTVTGGGGYCVGGAGDLIGLSSSSATASYQLYFGSTPSGVAVAGTGTAISFGTHAATGTYSVVGIDNTTFCSSNMSNTVVVSLNPIPTAYNVTGGGTYCVGGTGLHVMLSGSDAPLSYQLYRDGVALGSALAGTGSSLDFGVFTASSSTYTVMATNPITTCSNSMTGSVTISTTPLPVVYTVTGGGSYCAGGLGDTVSITSSDVDVNYQLFNGFTPVGAAVGGTGSEINFGYETMAGSYTVTATDAVTGCTSNMSSLATVVINPLPNNTFSVTGGGSYCAGGTGEPVGLSGSNTGISYQLYDGTSAVGFPVAGTGTALGFGTKTAAGTYTVIATNSSTFCTSSMTGSETIVVNPLPVVDTVTGGGNYCPGASGLHIGLSTSSTGTNYQLYRGSTAIAFPVAGTGSALDFGAQTITGTYFVTATIPATGCSINMTGSAAIGINTPPTAFVLSSSASSYCAGGTGVSISLSGSNVGVNYQLYMGTTPVGAAMAGTSFGLHYGLFTTAGTYAVVATSTSTGCSDTMTGTPAIAVNPLPNVYTVSGGGSYCAGGTGFDVSLGGSDVGVSYQLYDGSTPVGTAPTGTGFSLDFGMQTAAGTYTVVASYGGTGCSTTMLSSAAITINSLPNAYIVDGGGNICSGTPGAHIGLSASDSGISYQLYNGTSAVGTALVSTVTSSPLDFGAQALAGTYTVKGTNPVTGCVSTMLGSTAVVVNPLPTVFTMSGGGSYCIGGAGAHVGLSGSATGVSYQLYIGSTTPVGSAMAGTGSAIDFGSMTTAGSYTVHASTIATGCTDSMSGSVVISINPLPTVYTVTGGGNYCSVTAGASIGLSHSQSGVNYQLYDGTTAVGSVLGGTGSTLDFGLHPSGGYSVVAINASTGCATDMTGTVTATPVMAVTPSVSIYTGVGDTVCAGTVVTYNVSTVNGGTGATYQWFVNGSPVTTSSSYSYTPINGNVVSVTMTSSLACVSPATANDNVTMVVLPNLTPSVSIAASTHDTICQGATVNFTATPVNGGLTPAYTWIVNGSTMAYGANYSYAPDNGDVIFAVMSSSYACRLLNTVLSNNISITVDSNIIPTVSINVALGASNGAVAFDDTLTAVATNAGPGATYEWLINGLVVSSASNPVLLRSTLNNNDVVTCIVSKTNACGVLSGSNQVVIALANVGVVNVNGANSDIQLVPNPNKGVFTLKGSLGTADDEEVTIEITDMIGQSIYTTKTTAHHGLMNETVHLGNTLANGMYILNLHSAAGNQVFHMAVEQ